MSSFLTFIKQTNKIFKELHPILGLKISRKWRITLKQYIISPCSYLSTKNLKFTDVCFCPEGLAWRMFEYVHTLFLQSPESFINNQRWRPHSGM